jgi:hypothetical protein
MRDISEDGRIRFNFGTFRWVAGTTTSACRCSRECGRCCLVRVWVPCAAVLCVCVCVCVCVEKFFFCNSSFISCRWYNRTSNNGHCRGIQILSVIGGVR